MEKKPATKAKKRTYLGPRGYTIYTEDWSARELKEIKEDLTFKPNVPADFGYGPPPESFPVFGKSKNKLFLPKFYGTRRFGKPQKTKIKDGEKINLEFSGSLRSAQVPAVNACLTAAHKGGGGILAMGCGFGKTCCALYIVQKLGVKALVVVNKEFLAVQWRERIEQFLPKARIGLIQQKKEDVKDKDIVIGMLQSIAMRDYDESVFAGFGVVIYDEVHGVPSRVFSRALRKITTKYHFGLSATPNRADGLTKVTKMYIGPVIHRMSKKGKKNPKGLHVIAMQPGSVQHTKCYRDLCNYRGKPDCVRMLSNLIKCPDRLLFLARVARLLAKNERHILVLSERIQYLHDLNKQITNLFKKAKETLPVIGYYIGGMKAKERKESETANIILATFAMAKEAMDIPILDTLILATPKSLSNIEQPIGRILRQESYPEDKPPLLVDMVDDVSVFTSWARKRGVFYVKNQYPIHMMHFEYHHLDRFNEEFEQCLDNLCPLIIEDIEGTEDEPEPGSSQVSQPTPTATLTKDVESLINDFDWSNI